MLSVSLGHAFAGDIHDAAADGVLGTVRALVEHDPKLVKQPDGEGWTALHHAAKNGRIEVVKYLVEHGADVNAPSSNGATPAYLAKGFKKTEVAAYLVEHGGSPTPVKVVRPAPSRTPALPPPPPPTPAIIEATQSTNLARVLEIIAENPRALGDQDAEGWTALHHAVNLGSVELAGALLKAGAAVGATNNLLATPLHLAAFRKQAKIAELLLNAKAEVNARDFINATPLIVAAGTGGANDVVALLLKAGADLNARNKNNVSALLISASLLQQDGVAETLVEAGAEINGCESMHGCAPIHYAIQRNNWKLLNLLLARNVDVTVQNKEGETPLSLARFEANADLAAVLEKRGAKMPPERALTPVEQSLADYYRGLHRTLTTGSFDDIRKQQSEVSPTQSEIAKLFKRNAAEAWHVTDEIKRNEIVALGAAAKSEPDKAKFLEMMRDGARAGEYIRVEPLPCSTAVRTARANGWLDPDVPAYLLRITRRGGRTMVVGDFFRLGDRWVLVPFVSKIFPELEKK